MSRFDDIKWKILYEIWEYAQRPRELARYTKRELEERVLSEDCISGMTRAAVESLASEGFLGTDRGHYYISEAGIRSIELEITDPNSYAYKIAHREDSIETEPSELSEPGPIPAADRFVTLDHNSDPYREAVIALDEAVAAFKEDRLLENEWGPEKGALLRTIRAGRELLEEGRVRVATILTTIIAPLKIVREQYEHAIVAGLVTAGADQLIANVSRAITSILRLVGLS